jgi:hypothetical protein
MRIQRTSIPSPALGGLRVREGTGVFLYSDWEGSIMHERWLIAGGFPFTGLRHAVSQGEGRTDGATIVA